MVRGIILYMFSIPVSHFALHKLFLFSLFADQEIERERDLGKNGAAHLRRAVQINEFFAYEILK